MPWPDQTGHGNKMEAVFDPAGGYVQFRGDENAQSCPQVLRSGPEARLKRAGSFPGIPVAPRCHM